MKSVFPKIAAYGFVGLWIASWLLAAAGQVPRSPLLDSWEQHGKLAQSSEFGLEWISLGPVMNSARAETVQADPARPGTMYAAFGAGNLWKTTSNGLTWRPIFNNQSALGIGAMVLAPSNPDVIWLGTGVNLKKPRNFTHPGTGVFRSRGIGPRHGVCMVAERPIRVAIRWTCAQVAERGC